MKRQSSSSRPRTQSRPRMPRSYGVKRTRRGMVSWSEADRRLTKAHNYWLVTSQKNGRAHVAPVWGLWLDGSFWFSTDPSSRKGRDMARNPYTVLHLESGDDVVIVEGIAERLTADSRLLARFVETYKKKYDFLLDTSNSSYGVYRLKPRLAYAWFEKDFPKSATRWIF
jgi:pyridoxamine 5'-phosphate oxidase-like protein